MDFHLIYYVQTNIICIAVLHMIKVYQPCKYEKQFSADSIVFNKMIFFSISACFSDMVAGICSGKYFPFDRAVIQISNIAYIEFLLVVSYYWLNFINIRLKLDISRKRQLFEAVPIVLFSLIILSNPFTEIVFKINSENRYSRNFGIYLHWLATWFYMVLSVIKIIKEIRKEKNSFRRNELKKLLAFAGPPIIAAVIHMLFYGVTVTQVGVTISLLVVFLMNTNSQILTDSLTGLNNRYGLNKYFDNHVFGHGGKSEITVALIDADKFKEINDKYGHTEGDNALIQISDALKISCGQFGRRVFICRYGGDEFLLSCKNFSDNERNNLKNMLLNEIDLKNRTNKNPYNLSISIGMAAEKCDNWDSFSRLIVKADENMYANKKNKKLKSR